ncbi:MAG: DNA photolyase [Gammaproteobacteria bacterium]|nr:DNA photolyase [Gammaproteobacteria bacterium]
MFSAVYIEEAVRDQAQVKAILDRLPELPQISIDQYGELFNRNRQNFRMQKQLPSLILAHKTGRRILPAPSGYGFESTRNGRGYYFSHMLNCIYDCRYCFLQGMFRSANYVLFVNYEDFQNDIETTISKSPAGSVFYSGYDCDSLALEPVSRFCSFILPLFETHNEHILEIRTKSTQTRFLLEREPLPNCIVAMSFSPKRHSERWEHKVPSVEKRLESLVRLQQAGWPVALRFEPVIAEPNVQRLYQELFELVFTELDPSCLHSVSLGEFRLPVDFYKKMVRLYPQEPLLAKEMQSKSGMITMANHSESLIPELERALLAYIKPANYYRCA